jgi:hypothetical protein
MATVGKDDLEIETQLVGWSAHLRCEQNPPAFGDNLNFSGKLHARVRAGASQILLALHPRNCKVNPGLFIPAFFRTA